jgi:hypothetical protein
MCVITAWPAKVRHQLLCLLRENGAYLIPPHKAMEVLDPCNPAHPRTSCAHPYHFAVNMFWGCFGTPVSRCQSMLIKGPQFNITKKRCRSPLVGTHHPTSLSAHRGDEILGSILAPMSLPDNLTSAVLCSVRLRPCVPGLCQGPLQGAWNHSLTPLDYISSELMSTWYSHSLTDLDYMSNA